ncbi:MAG: hypothetical protein IPH08_04050 [Rhodocyclaceae bacterium]|nr:hypothetical protein [Rhodocyclaceae bacterium]MBK6906305.1 hypothetical protein [Rhodocyclaceae bacterium]
MWPDALCEEGSDLWAALCQAVMGVVDGMGGASSHAAYEKCKGLWENHLMGYNGEG